MIRVTLLLVMCSMYITLLSQQTKDSSLKKYVVPAHSWTLRWNTINLIDIIEPNLSVGAEYRIKEKLSVASDVGYVFFNSTLQTSNVRVSGIVIKPSVRYYLNDNLRFYAEGELLIKKVNHKVEDWLGQNCVNNVPSYEEFKKFTIRKNVMGFQAKIGRVGRLSKDNKFSLDWYIGVGLRVKGFKLINEPNTCYNFRDFDLFRLNSNDQKTLLPSMPLGFRLTYVL
jgi:hypothetical protein